MATPEFGTGKVILVLALIVGCFAILWPRVFFPMMQTAFIMTRPSVEGGERVESGPKTSPVCCDVVYSYDIDNKFFARLCEMVVQREEVLGRVSPPPSQKQQKPAVYGHGKLPGVAQICRETVRELCGYDIGGVLTDDPRSNSYMKALEDLHAQNVTHCLRNHYEKHEKFLVLAGKMRQRMDAVRKQVRQERPSHPHSSAAAAHPAMKERGVPIASRIHEHVVQKPKPPGPIVGARPSPGGYGKNPPPSPKGATSMGFVMPMYTLGIVIFFIYTVIKFWEKFRARVVMFKRSAEEDRTPKVMDFHMDPEYRKFVLSEQYEDGGSYYPSAPEDKSGIRNYNGDQEQKVVFTAIEGIIAEMDEYRERLKTEQTESESAAPATEGVQKIEEVNGSAEANTGVKDIDSSQIQQVDATTPIPAPAPFHAAESQGVLSQGSKPIRPSIASAVMLRDSLQAQASLDDSDLLPTIPEDTRVAVLGMETQFALEDSGNDNALTSEDGEKTPTFSAYETGEPEKFIGSHSHAKTTEFKVPKDVTNIMLEGSMPAESQLLVAESQCSARPATPDVVDESSSDMCLDYNAEEPPVVITGKMTISVINSVSQGGHADLAHKPESKEEGVKIDKCNASSNCSLP